MIKFAVKYEAGHQYEETWGPTDFYCPACGAKDVWADESGGDYYVGNQYLCRACWASFYLPHGAEIPHERDWQHRQRREALSTVKSSGEGK